MKWDPEHPERRPDAREVALTCVFLLALVATAVWAGWTVQVWANGKLTIYDIGMPAALLLLVLATTALGRGANRTRARNISAAPNPPTAAAPDR